MNTSRWAYAYGHLDVTVAVLTPPADDVRAQLAPRLRLAPQALTPAGTHPQLLMFGQHSHVRPFFEPSSAGGSYDEWIIATPFLEWADGGHDTSWATMSRLFLNSLWYTALGWMYGYPKEMAKMAVTPDAYEVRTEGGEPRVEMRWRATGPEVAWAAWAPAARLAPVFGQPFIQHLGVEPWLGSRMWFELTSSTVQPVALDARIEDGCAPHFAGRTIDIGSVEDGLPGAFRLSVDWMLSRPYPAGALPAELRLPAPPA